MIPAGGVAELLLRGPDGAWKRSADPSHSNWAWPKLGTLDSNSWGIISPEAIRPRRALATRRRLKVFDLLSGQSSLLTKGGPEFFRCR